MCEFWRFVKFAAAIKVSRGSIGKLLPLGQPFAAAPEIICGGERFFHIADDYRGAGGNRIPRALQFGGWARSCMSPTRAASTNLRVSAALA
jgi:hypothetical protein